MMGDSPPFSMSFFLRIKTNGFVSKRRARNTTTVVHYTSRGRGPLLPIWFAANGAQREKAEAKHRSQAHQQDCFKAQSNKGRAIYERFLPLDPTPFSNRLEFGVQTFNTSKRGALGQRTQTTFD